MRKQIFIALRFLLVMTLLTGIVYPVAMTCISQLIFPYRSNGSLINRDSKLVGSELIGQKFDNDRYFWTRPSATDYNAVPSGGSNYGPTSNTLKSLVILRKKHFAQENLSGDTLNVPGEMMFSSASGLDPHISPGSALLQVDRLVKSRHLQPGQRDELVSEIKKMTEGPQFNILGEPRINVLKLNLKLDEIDKNPTENK
jgi:potassium-transporting ATPase KdpC subunit